MSMRRGWAAALLAASGLLAAAGVLPAAARGAAPGRLVDQIVHRGALADGERHAVYITPDRVVHVVDELVAGGSFDEPLPPECIGLDSPNVLFGGGQLLVGCGPGKRAGGRAATVRLELASRSWHVVARDRWPRSPGGFRSRAVAIGARWLQLQTGELTRPLYDWRSGELRADPADATDAVDLDAADGRAAICPPLRRLWATPIGLRPYLLPAEFDGTTLITRTPEETLTAQRCDEARPTVIAVNTTAPQLAGGVATFTAIAPRRNGRRNVFAYLPACRLRLGWRLRQPLHATHTRAALWISSWSWGGPRRVRRIALPAGCRAIPRRPPALRVAAGGAGRRLPAQTWTAARWDDATVSRLPRLERPLPLVARAGATVTVRTRSAAAAVRWSVGGRAARRAQPLGSGGRRWRFAAPRAAGVVPVTVTVAGRAPHARTTFAFRLGRGRGR